MNTLRFKNRFVYLCAVAAVGSFGILAATGQLSEKRAAVTDGKKAPSFQARTLDGKTVKFPDDYKGKVVLLDFWATWCAPCVRELPNVAAAYQQYHARGFEILSVSLDNPEQGAKVLQFTRDHKMSWPQVYDGAEDIAATYGVEAIPCPILVDGDTGKVLVQGDEAVGPGLVKALKPALAGKARK